MLKLTSLLLNPITLCYLFLTVFSLVILSSIAPDNLLSQAVFFGLGFLLMLYLGSQEISVYQSFSLPLYFLALLLLLLTILLADPVRGSSRWLEFGIFRLQASELIKPFMIVSFSQLLTQFTPSTVKNVILNSLFFLLPVILIFLQPDLGTALVVSAIFVSQLIVAGLSPWYLFPATVGVVIAWQNLSLFLHDYQLKRLIIFLNPSSDPLGAGYNVLQSIIAVGSGSIFGLGLGQGTQSHLRFLPERHTDFIFASLSEELGLVGAIFVLSCLGYLLYYLLTQATHARSQSVRLIYLGTFSYLFFQTFINIGMNIGIAPVTGVTLPLISYGGSSILATAISLGITLSAARSERHPSLLEIR